MHPDNLVPVPKASLPLLLALCALLASCAAQPASKTYTRYLTGSANPIGVQTGNLTVVTLDLNDGGALSQATVDVVAAGGSANEPLFYRRSGTSDRRGMVTFRDVPRLVNVSITHSRGEFSLDNYVVPQGTPSEFRVYVETRSPRTRAECLGYLLC